MPPIQDLGGNGVRQSDRVIKALLGQPVGCGKNFFLLQLDTSLDMSCYCMLEKVYLSSLFEHFAVLKYPLSISEIMVAAIHWLLFNFQIWLATIFRKLRIEKPDKTL